MATATFVRRENPDSTTDVICLKCFQTIAKKLTGEAGLTDIEPEHKCHPLQQEHYYSNQQSA